MFSPEMMQAAQKMMANMKPEDMQRMSQMAANMDPKVMENMMKGMGGGNMPVDTAQALEQMKNMTPEQMQAGMSQAQNQMSAQRQYMYNAAEMLKNEGNTEVKNERYTEALAKYNKALENLSGHVGDSVAALKLNLLNNVALCHLKTKAHQKAFDACEEALKVDPQSFKALFRRGQARENLGSLQEAVADVRRAADLAPGDKAIARELDRLRAELKDRGLEELEVSAAWQTPAATPSTSSGSRATSSSSRAGAASAAAGADHWAQAAERIAENPDMLQQATEAMSKMTPEQLQNMMGNAPLPPGMDPGALKTQMEMLQKNPDMLRTAMDSLKALPPEERKKIIAQRGAMGGGGPPANMSQIFENPEMVQQAMDMTKGMSEEDLKRLNMSGQDAEMMRKAAEQMTANPDLMKSMSEMMKNMPPEQLESMMNLSAKMRGGGGPGGMDGPGAMDPSALLNDPEMMKAAEQMMKSMSPETLASMAKASGVDLSEDKAKMITRFLPYMLKLLQLFGYLKKAWTAMCSARGRVVLAVVVLIFAMLQHYRG